MGSPVQMAVLFIFAACAFAGGFALRLAVAGDFGVSAATAALLGTGFAVPYAVAQLFLGPIGDRYGKLQCIRVCSAGLAAALVLCALAPAFGLLLSARAVAGVFGGGLIPLVLASLGDRYGMQERQVMIGRMLFAIISGQMLGSMVGGAVGESAGWRSAMAAAAAVGVLAALAAWLAVGGEARKAEVAKPAPQGLVSGYAPVFRNPKAVWVYGCVAAEGMLFFGFFPYIGMLLGAHADGGSVAATQAGLVLGAFGAGGLLYAASVRQLVLRLGVSRMCSLGLLGGALGCAAVAFAPSWWQAAAMLVLAGYGFYMLHNSLQVQATELAPSARGSAVALLAFCFFAGQGLGPPVFGWLAHQLGPTASLLALALGMVALGQVVVHRVCRNLESPAPSSHRRSNP